MRSPLPLFLLIMGLALQSGCATNPATGQQDLVLMSEGQELAAGRQMNAQVLKQYRRYDNPALQAYVQRIGERLAAHGDRPNLVYRFTVLDSPEVNAFALPGGYIYVERGLLAYLNSESELAAVLAHEIGHVTARHAVRQQTTATATGLVGAILAARSGVQGAQDLANVVGTAVVRGYGREYELQADHLGAEYLARSGYDPHAMLRVLRLLKHQEEYEVKLAREEHRQPHVYHGLFASHPDNDQRLKAVLKTAQQYGSGPYRDDRDGYLHEIDGLTFGPGAAEGTVRNGRFYHTGLGISVQFPRDWRVDNRSDRVVASAPDGNGWIQMTAQDLNLRLTPRQFLVRRLGLTSLAHGEEVNSHGLAGYTAITAANTPFGRRPARVTVLYFGNRAYLFASACRDARQPFLYDRQAIDTARSFRPLRPDEKHLAEAEHIHVITAHGPRAIERLARNAPFSQDAATRLRLLNGLYPDGEPAAGQLLKEVR